MQTKSAQKFYIVSISIHGLIRARNIEYGKDADTGGQIRYVLEQAKSLVQRPMVAKVDLITRRIQDRRLSQDYAHEIEPISENLNIVRIPAGPRRYIVKEKLWDYLEVFVDNAIKYFRAAGETPDIIYAHYADAGLVASKLASILDIPMIFTGHSLGKLKRDSLIEDGHNRADIENIYHIGKRIEAEEKAIEVASIIVASTKQEVDIQYSKYDHYDPRRIFVIPPGVDLEKFTPPSRFNWLSPISPIQSEVQKFLREPLKPMILAIARADEKKNLTTLIDVYGQSIKLQDIANLVIMAGSRSDIKLLAKEARSVINKILFLIDYYNLYGKVAYPKSHQSEDIGHVYRMAAKSLGVFVNPALNEPFGLTLLEAAASGLPVVATANGGAGDIVKICQNGLVVDPLDIDAIEQSITSIIEDKTRWSQYSIAGLSNSKKFFSWDLHTKSLMKLMKSVIQKDQKNPYNFLKRRLMSHEKMLICDIDGTLTTNSKELGKLIKMLSEKGNKVGFGIATGRNLQLTLEALNEFSIPIPNFLITSVGSELFYGPKLVKDNGYDTHLNYKWKRSAIVDLLSDLEGLTLQEEDAQNEHKISYFIDPKLALKVKDINRLLRNNNITANLIFSHGMFLDILPIRANKGLALRYLANKFNVAMDKIMVAGDSGNDEDMLVGSNIGVVVGGYNMELNKLRNSPNVYFATGHGVAGIIEAIKKYNFFD